LSIFEAAAISMIACLLATAILLRSIARMDIVTSIETVESLDYIICVGYSKKSVDYFLKIQYNIKLNNKQNLLLL